MSTYRGCLKSTLSHDELTSVFQNARIHKFKLTKRGNNFLLRKTIVGRDSFLATLTLGIENVGDYRSIEWLRGPRIGLVIFFMMVTIFGLVLSLSARDWFSMIVLSLFVVLSAYKLINYDKDTKDLVDVLVLVLSGS